MKVNFSKKNKGGGAKIRKTNKNHSISVILSTLHFEFLKRSDNIHLNGQIEEQYPPDITHHPNLRHKNKHLFFIDDFLCEIQYKHKKSIF